MKQKRKGKKRKKDERGNFQPHQHVSACDPCVDFEGDIIHEPWSPFYNHILTFVPTITFYCSSPWHSAQAILFITIARSAPFSIIAICAGMLWLSFWVCRLTCVLMHVNWLLGVMASHYMHCLVIIGIHHRLLQLCFVMFNTTWCFQSEASLPLLLTCHVHITHTPLLSCCYMLTYASFFVFFPHVLCLCCFSLIRWLWTHYTWESYCHSKASSRTGELSSMSASVKQNNSSQWTCMCSVVLFVQLVVVVVVVVVALIVVVAGCISHLFVSHVFDCIMFQYCVFSVQLYSGGLSDPFVLIVVDDEPVARYESSY